MASMGKDVRFAPKPSDREDHADLFKMSKFKKVGSVLCTQPNAYS